MATSVAAAANAALDALQTRARSDAGRGSRSACRSAMSIAAPGAIEGTPPALLGDTAQRDYARKLQLFNAFAERELRQGIAGLDIRSGMRILDAGCGTGD